MKLNQISIILVSFALFSLEIHKGKEAGFKKNEGGGTVMWNLKTLSLVVFVFSFFKTVSLIFFLREKNESSQDCNISQSGECRGHILERTVDLRIKKLISEMNSIVIHLYSFGQVRKPL